MPFLSIYKKVIETKEFFDKTILMNIDDEKNKIDSQIKQFKQELEKKFDMLH